MPLDGKLPLKPHHVREQTRNLLHFEWYYPPVSPTSGIHCAGSNHVAAEFNAIQCPGINLYDFSIQHSHSVFRNPNLGNVQATQSYIRCSCS